MKDSFEASGIAALPTDVNDIEDIVVTITSVTDDEEIYTETLDDFNATTVHTSEYTSIKLQPPKVRPAKLLP